MNNVKPRRLLPGVFLLSLTTSSVAADTAENVGKAPGFVSTTSVGLSYPLVASISRGVFLPLSRNAAGAKPYRFDDTAIQASVDVGIGGGMVSGGFFVPVKNTGATLSAVSAKGAILRPWLVDLGPERYRTYKGAIIEFLGAAAGMGGKYGVGYFRSDETGPSRLNGFVYVYAGLGF